MCVHPLSPAATASNPPAVACQPSPQSSSPPTNPRQTPAASSPSASGIPLAAAATAAGPTAATQSPAAAQVRRHLPPHHRDVLLLLPLALQSI